MLGRKLGEGNHAAVYECFQRVKPRSNSDATTPLLVDKMRKDEYLPQPYAVKIVRSDDLEKIKAHKREFDILSTLKHKNVVRVIEMFNDEFKN